MCVCGAVVGCRTTPVIRVLCRRTISDCLFLRHRCLCLVSLVSLLSFVKAMFIYWLIYYMCTLPMLLKIKEQLTRVIYYFLPFGTQGQNSSCQAWRQASLPSEPFFLYSDGVSIPITLCVRIWSIPWDEEQQVLRKAAEYSAPPSAVRAHNNV